MSLSKSLWTKLLAVSLGATMALGVGLTASRVADEVNASSASISSFSALSGAIDSNISYASYKGGGTSAPAVNTNQIRLYQNASGSVGGYITISASAGYKISAFATTSGMATSLDYSVGNATSWSGNKTSVAVDVAYSQSGLDASNVSIGCFGTTSSTRYYVKTLTITYASSSADIVTALSVTPTSKSYFTTDTLVSSAFSVSVTKNGSAGSSTDYTAQIGTGTGNGFSGSDIVWDSTKPTTSNQTIQFKAKYPTAAGGTTYLTADVALTITEPTLSSIAISGSLTKTDYYTTDSWDHSGLTVIATYSNSATSDVTSSVSWSYDPATPNSTSITSVSITATYGGKTSNASKSVTVTEKASTIIIYELYGNGGNSGATLNQDYIVLYNTTSSSQSIIGWTIQYGSATGSTWTMSSVLSGSINPKSYYLVTLAAAGANGLVLPCTPDSSVSGINAGGTNFKIVLVKNNTNLGSVADPADSTNFSNVVDFIGAGTANAYEGSGAASAGSVTNSVTRKSLSDTDNNSADFEAIAPSPKNSTYGASGVVQYLMAADTEGQCSTKYSTAKSMVTALDAYELNVFQTDIGSYYANAKSRYLAWAVNRGDSSPFSASGAAVIVLSSDNPNLIVYIIAISFLAISSITGFYFFKKKKEAI